MGRLFTAANSEYFEADTAALTGVPLSFSAWIRTNNVDISETIMGLFDLSQSAHYVRLRVSGNEAGDLLSATVNTGGGGLDIDSTSGVTINTWHHALFVGAAVDDWRIYIDGANKGTSTGSRTSSGLDRTTIGRMGDSTPGQHFDGDIAEAAIIAAILNDDDAVGLAGGGSILRTARSSLNGYWPLYARTGNAPDYSGNGLDLTEFNSVTLSDHPPVAPSFGFDMGWQGLAAEAAAIAVTNNLQRIRATSMRMGM